MRAVKGLQRSAIILPVIIIMILSIVAGCSIESPKAPDWDTNITFPLISRHYDIYELIDRMAEDALSYDSAGNLSLSFDQHMDTITIDAGLSAEQVSEYFNHQLGDIAIASPQPLSLELNLSDYVSLATGEVPDVGFDANKDFDQIQEFQTATFSEGSLIVSVTNYFDVAIDSLTIRIVDIQSSDTIAEYTVSQELNVGENRTDTISLAGKTASNQLSFNSWIHTPGGTVLSTNANYLAVEMTVADGATVTSAIARVSAQEKDYSSSVSFVEEHRITSASISWGQINIHIQNNSELASNLEIEVPELSESGNPISISATIPANGEYNYSQDISGYEIQPDLTNGSMAVNFNLIANIPGSGNDMVEVSSTDQFTIEAGMTDLQFSQATGIIAPTEIEINPVHETIDLPKGFEDVSLTDAVLILDIYSEVNIPTDVDINITGGTGQYLNITSQLSGGTPENPGVTHLIISDLEPLTNPVPSEITVAGIAVAGDGASTGTVYADARVWGDIEISSPLKFAIGETEIEGDINSTDIDQDDIDDFSDRLNQGSIYATITNHLPFGCEVELHLNGDSATLFSDPQLTIGPLAVNAGSVDANGLVGSAEVSEIQIHLSDTDLDIIYNPTLYIGQKVYLPGTGGQVVNIIGTDYLDIEAYIRLNARVGGEWN